MESSLFLWSVCASFPKTGVQLSLILPTQSSKGGVFKLLISFPLSCVFLGVLVSALVTNLFLNKIMKGWISLTLKKEKKKKKLNELIYK